MKGVYADFKIKLEAKEITCKQFKEMIEIQEGNVDLDIEVQKGAQKLKEREKEVKEKIAEGESVVKKAKNEYEILLKEIAKIRDEDSKSLNESLFHFIKY